MINPKLVHFLTGMLLFFILPSSLDAQLLNCNTQGRYKEKLINLPIKNLNYKEANYTYAKVTPDDFWNGGVGLDGIKDENICFDPDYAVTVQNGENHLKMKVMYPLWDVCSNRGLVIFVHGSGYLHTKSTNELVKGFALDYVQRGYVVAMINYRKGWDISAASFENGDIVNAPFGNTPPSNSCDCEDDCDPFSFMKATYRMVQDVRAAHRKLLNLKNQLKIDPDKVFYYGISTGAVAAIHAGFAHDDLPAYTNSANESLAFLLGGIDAIGDPVTNGAPFKIAGVSTLAGGIHNLSWIESSDNTPVFMSHGTEDEAVDFCMGNIARLQFNSHPQTPYLTLYGGGSVFNHIKNLNASNTKAILSSFTNGTHALIGKAKLDEINMQLATGIITTKQELTAAQIAAIDCNCNELDSDLEIFNFNQSVHSAFAEAIIKGNFTTWPNLELNIPNLDQANVSCSSVLNLTEDPCPSVGTGSKLAQQSDFTEKVSNFILYPNPISGDQLSFSIEAVTAQKAWITIYSMDGKKQLDQFIPLEVGKNIGRIETTSLQKGLLKAVLIFENGDRITQSLLVL